MMVLVTDTPTLEHPYHPVEIRFFNWAGSLLRRSGLPLANLSVESLLSTAQNLTGLSDWGNESFQVSLRILLESLETEANLNFFGRYAFRQKCIRLLVNRLRIQDDLKRYPEIWQVPIRRPLFITALYRSGTTLLHNLLSCDPASRSLCFWEADSPSPPPNLQTRESDPRIKKAQKVLKLYNYLAPRAVSVHAMMNSTGPEECILLFDYEFLSTNFESLANVPSYSKWLKAHDMVAPYRYYRQLLQLLGWRCPGDHWVLKAPAHLFSLDTLMTVFPDACIIQTHRDPLRALPSLCSMNATNRGMFTDRVDLAGVGEFWLNRLADGVERGMQAREFANPAQFYDVNYNSLVQNPIGTVRQIYEYFGYDFHPPMEENMKRWISENPQHKHGVHQYSLEQFGLEPVVVNQRFAKYRQRFKISTELGERDCTERSAKGNRQMSGT
ncbi:MAG: sulfotransferase [Iphinoe sp. HA4291-MV1]|jgi:hypothetical protein|nr:sulfotransferase [Iphinoe sp. HA4291-MV1]